MIKCPSLAVHI